MSVAEVAQAQVPKESGRLRIYFPELALAHDDGERVTSVELTLTCGRFRAVHNIPDDWSLVVVSPSSEVTTLEADAGHGSTAIWSLAELDGSIEISVDDKSCLEVDGVVVSETSNEVHRHVMTRANIALRRPH